MGPTDLGSGALACGVTRRKLPLKIPRVQCLTGLSYEYRIKLLIGIIHVRFVSELPNTRGGFAALTRKWTAEADLTVGTLGARATRPLATWDRGLF